MNTIKLWGFSGSTYVRTVRMLLAEKGVADYEQVPVNVLSGEPKGEVHLERRQGSERRSPSVQALR